MSATNEQDNDATAAQILDDAEKDHRGPGTADSSHQIHPATQPAETEEVYDRTTTGEHPKTAAEAVKEDAEHGSGDSGVKPSDGGVAGASTTSSSTAPSGDQAVKEISTNPEEAHAATSPPSLETRNTANTSGGSTIDGADDDASMIPLGKGKRTSADNTPADKSVEDLPVSTGGHTVGQSTKTAADSIALPSGGSTTTSPDAGAGLHSDLEAARAALIAKVSTCPEPRVVEFSDEDRGTEDGKQEVQTALSSFPGGKEDMLEQMNRGTNVKVSGAHGLTKDEAAGLAESREKEDGAERETAGAPSTSTNNKPLARSGSIAKTGPPIGGAAAGAASTAGITSAVSSIPTKQDAATTESARDTETVTAGHDGELVEKLRREIRDRIIATREGKHGAETHLPGSLTAEEEAELNAALAAALHSGGRTDGAHKSGSLVDEKTASTRALADAPRTQDTAGEGQHDVSGVSAGALGARAGAAGLGAAALARGSGTESANKDLEVTKKDSATTEGTQSGLSATKPSAFTEEFGMESNNGAASTAGATSTSAAAPGAATSSSTKSPTTATPVAGETTRSPTSPTSPKLSYADAPHSKKESSAPGMSTSPSKSGGFIGGLFRRRSKKVNPLGHKENGGQGTASGPSEGESSPISSGGAVINYTGPVLSKTEFDENGNTIERAPKLNRDSTHATSGSSGEVKEGHESSGLGAGTAAATPAAAGAGGAALAGTAAAPHKDKTDEPVASTTRTTRREGDSTLGATSTEPKEIVSTDSIAVPAAVGTTTSPVAEEPQAGHADAAPEMEAAVSTPAATTQEAKKLAAIDDTAAVPTDAEQERLAAAGPIEETSPATTTETAPAATTTATAADDVDGAPRENAETADAAVGTEVERAAEGEEASIRAAIAGNNPAIEGEVGPRSLIGTREHTAGAAAGGVDRGLGAVATSPARQTASTTFQDAPKSPKSGGGFFGLFRSKSKRNSTQTAPPISAARQTPGLNGTAVAASPVSPTTKEASTSTEPVSETVVGDEATGAHGESHHDGAAAIAHDHEGEHEAKDEEHKESEEHVPEPEPEPVVDTRTDFEIAADTPLPPPTYTAKTLARHERERKKREHEEMVERERIRRENELLAKRERILNAYTGKQDFSKVPTPVRNKPFGNKKELDGLQHISKASKQAHKQEELTRTTSRGSSVNEEEPGSPTSNTKYVVHENYPSPPTSPTKKSNRLSQVLHKVQSHTGTQR